MPAARRLVTDAREVDEAALRVGAQQLHAHPVADIKTRGALLDPAFDRHP